MQKRTFRFANSKVDYFFEARFAFLQSMIDVKNTVFITDENVFGHHSRKFKNKNLIVLKAGEEYKVQLTVDSIIQQLIEMGADRKTMLVGVGGGVITDLTGFAASVYMRGVPFGFVPTTVLAMVDASVGGKNGIDVDVYKNLVGTIRQPSFILYDQSFLNTLPENEWQNGFAEIIKHAVIKNASMFNELELRQLSFFQRRKTEFSSLLYRNVLIKTKLVQSDEFEQGERKLLNFGHTLGHALENQYELSHGEAISIGMGYASTLSKMITGFKDPERVINLLEQYGLPVFAEFDKDKVITVLRMDKKKQQSGINFILLEKIGRALIKEISIEQLYQNL